MVEGGVGAGRGCTRFRKHGEMRDRRLYGRRVHLPRGVGKAFEDLTDTCTGTVAFLGTLGAEVERVACCWSADKGVVGYRC